MVQLTDSLAAKKGMIVIVSQGNKPDVTGRFGADTTLDTIWRWSVQAVKGVPDAINVRLDEAFEPVHRNSIGSQTTDD